MLGSIAELKKRWGVDGAIEFSEGNGGLTKVALTSSGAVAELYLYGGHITSFVPHDSSEVLWMSSQSQFQVGKAIRGGVPLIWPWFGAHPTDSASPQHGYLRTSFFEIVAGSVLPSGDVRLELGLEGATERRGFEADVAYVIEVGKTLSTSLEWVNNQAEAQTYGAALHSYFSVSDAECVSFRDLSGLTYIDKVAGGAEFVQSNPLKIEGEVDRIYLDTDHAVQIVDEGLGRVVTVSKSGSRSTVVWNPGAEKARAMADFPDDGYRTMVCVEVANAGSDVRTLRAGDKHTISQVISVGNVS